MLIRIRKAEPRDTGVIADFNIRLALETEDLRLDPQVVEAGVAALLAHPERGIYFLAEAEGAVAGQLMITYEWSDWRNGNLWWLQSVYVAPEFRQRGVFRALFSYLEQLARQDSNVCGLRLYMHSTNERARQTYERLGLSSTHYQVFEKDLRERVGSDPQPLG